MRSGSLSLFQPIPSPSQSFPFSYHTKQLFLLIIPANSNYQQHAPPATLITAISRTLRNWLKRFTLLLGLQQKTNSFSSLCVYFFLLLLLYFGGGRFLPLYYFKMVKKRSDEEVRTYCIGLIAWEESGIEMEWLVCGFCTQFLSSVINWFHFFSFWYLWAKYWNFCLASNNLGSASGLELWIVFIRSTVTATIQQQME